MLIFVCALAFGNLFIYLNFNFNIYVYIKGMHDKKERNKYVSLISTQDVAFSSRNYEE